MTAGDVDDRAELREVVGVDDGPDCGTRQARHRVIENLPELRLVAE